MTPTTVLLVALQNELATDTDGLAAATALHAHLIKEPFTPDNSTDFTTLTEADFDGYAALGAGTGVQQQFSDPVTGRLVVQMKEPAGGWHWQTTGVTNLPQTIYGVVLTNTDDDETFGAVLFDTPITLTGTGQAIDVPFLRFEFIPPVLV